jgi:hypothetical protein
MAISKKKSDSVSQKAKIEDKSESLNDSNRNRWIKEAAYYMAETRGFIPGYEKRDWGLAEKEYARCAEMEQAV